MESRIISIPKHNIYIPNIFFYKDSGSFGIVVYDKDDLLYKITNLSVSQNKTLSDSIERNNLVELILSNYFKNSNKNHSNIIQSEQIYYITYEELKDFRFHSKIYDDFKWINEPNGYNIFNHMKKYDTNLSKIIINSNKKYFRKDFLTIASQLLTGLNNFHSNGLLHGDIKTSNILVKIDKTNGMSRINEYVLVDYGGIKPSGTFAYLRTCTITNRSPEELQIEFDPKYNFVSNFKNDIWSLGIVFAEILLGYNPMLKKYYDFKSSTLNEFDCDKKFYEYYQKIEKIDIIWMIKNQLEKEKIDLNSNFSKNILLWVNTIQKMLYINPDLRIGSIQEIYYELIGETLPDVKIIYDKSYQNYLTDSFFNFRREFYKKVIELSYKLTYVDVIPLQINLLDRYFSKLIKKNNLINNFDIDFPLEEFEMIGLSVIYLSSIWCQDDIIDFDFIKKLTRINTEFYQVKEFIIKMLLELDYDIYRPLVCNTNTIDTYNKCIYLIENNIVDFDYI